MSESATNKCSVVLHAIAITVVLAIISGQLPLSLFPGQQFQSGLHSIFKVGKL
jgi:hypothetical protein